MDLFNKNPLSRLLSKYPDMPWNWYRLSWNRNITWEIVEKNSDKTWNWKLSKELYKKQASKSYEILRKLTSK